MMNLDYKVVMWETVFSDSLMSLAEDKGKK